MRILPRTRSDLRPFLFVSFAFFAAKFPAMIQYLALLRHVLEYGRFKADRIE